MYIYKHIKKFLLESFPIILLYILAFSSFEGIKESKNCNIFPGCVISAIPQDLKFQDYFRFSKFIAGLFNDVVIGTPIGLSSLMYLILCVATSYIRNVTLRSKMTTEWFTFIPAIFFSNLIYFIIINNFSNLSFYYLLLIILFLLSYFFLFFISFFVN